MGWQSCRQRGRRSDDQQSADLNWNVNIRTQPSRECVKFVDCSSCFNLFHLTSHELNKLSICTCSIESILQLKLVASLSFTTFCSLVICSIFAATSRSQVWFVRGPCAD